MPTNDNAMNNPQQRRATEPLLNPEERTAQQALAQQYMDHEWAKRSAMEGHRAPLHR